MSKGFSFAQVGGTLGRDPESRSTSGGTKVVNFSVAVEKGFGEKPAPPGSISLRLIRTRSSPKSI